MQALVTPPPSPLDLKPLFLHLGLGVALTFEGTTRCAFSFELIEATQLASFAYTKASVKENARLFETKASGLGVAEENPHEC